METLLRAPPAKSGARGGRGGEAASHYCLLIGDRLRQHGPWERWGLTGGSLQFCQ